MSKSLKLFLGISYILILCAFLYLIFSYVEIKRLDDFLYYKELQISLEKIISESFPERTDVQCLHRWQKVLNPNLIKGPWTPEEDAKVKALVKELGP